MITRAVIFISILAILPGCSKSTKDEPINPEKIHYKGWGSISQDAPEGMAWELPAGIEFVEAAHYSMDPEDECYRKDPLSTHASGNGSLVTLCVSFLNKTNRPITLTLPSGLIFISRTRSVQNGILAERVSIEIPAATRYFHQFNLQCMNSDRDPSGYGTYWDLGPITDVAAATELFDFIADKDLYKDMILGATVQVAVREIGDDGAISDYVWSQLMKIPRK